MSLLVHRVTSVQFFCSKSGCGDINSVHVFLLINANSLEFHLYKSGDVLNLVMSKYL